MWSGSGVRSRRSVTAVLRPAGIGIPLLALGFGLVVGDLAEVYAAFVLAAGVVAG